MPPDPRGSWFRVYSRQVRQHPKFRALDHAAKGAWLDIRAEVDLLDGEPLASRRDALLVLQLTDPSRVRCNKLLDQLVAVGLVDELDDGRIAIHDREHHDRGPYPSDAPERVKERVDRHRERTRNDSGNEPVTSAVTSAVTGRNERIGNDVTTPRARVPRAEERRVEKKRGEQSARDPASDLPDRDDSVTEACRYLPDGGRWLADDEYRAAWDDLVRRFGDEWVLDELPVAYDELLRTKQRVKAWDLKKAVEFRLAERTRAEELAASKARTRAEQKANGEHQRAIAEATPEQREQAAWVKAAIRIATRARVQVPEDPDEVRAFVRKHDPTFEPRFAT